MRRKYKKIDIESYQIESQQCFLTGSVTPVDITINKVEVEDFKSGFTDENGNDFKELTFD